MSDHPAFSPLSALPGEESYLTSARLEAVETRLAARAKSTLNGLSALTTAQDWLSAVGWPTTNWGQALFATQAGPEGAPALLIYFPPDPAQPYNLAALTLAWSAWQDDTGSGPVTLKLLVGPVDQATLLAHSEELAASAVVYSQGEYSEGRPLVSLGLKGLVQVELRVNTMSQPAPSAYSEILPAASWTLLRVLDSLKSDTQEIKIDHFEDGLAPLPAAESRRLLQSVAGQSERLARRLARYGLKNYLFELRDSLVLQTEYLVPTVNVSAFECGSFDEAGALKLPATARARVDFHLVPDQEPAHILELLSEHLRDNGFEEIELTELPGQQRPARTPLDTPFVERVLAVAEVVSGAGSLIAPISPFSGPLASLKSILGNVPAVCVGLSEENTASEENFAAHSRFLARLLAETADLFAVSVLPEVFFELPPDLPVQAQESVLPLEIFQASELTFSPSAPASTSDPTPTLNGTSASTSNGISDEASFRVSDEVLEERELTFGDTPEFLTQSEGSFPLSDGFLHNGEVDLAQAEADEPESGPELFQPFEMPFSAPVGTDEDLAQESPEAEEEVPLVPYTEGS